MPSAQGNVPDFIAAGQAGWNFGRNVRRDIALSDAERDPGVNPDAGYTYPNVDDVGPPQAGMEDAQGATMPTITQPQPMTPDQRMARRASVYRQYGEDAEADRMLQANAQLGLTNAQTGEVVQRTANDAIKGQSDQVGLDVARRANDAAVAQKKIRDAVAGKLGALTDGQGQPRQPTQDEIIDNQKELASRLYAAGHADAAAATVKEMKASIEDRIKADSDVRKEAANQVAAAVQRGDYSTLPAFIKRFDYAGSDVHIERVAPAGPGMVAVTVSGPQGTTTKPMKEADFRAMAMRQLQMQASDNAAVAEQSGRLVDAQIDQAKAGTVAHLAAAGASGASADHLRAETDRVKGQTAREKTLEDARAAAADALDKPEDQRTPDDNQAIKKWTVLQTLERSRAGGAAGGAANQARTMNGKVNGRDVTIRTGNDGTPGEYLDQRGPTDKSMVWKPIQRGDAVQVAPQASPSGGGATSIPMDPKQRVVGQVYTNAAGTRAKWTGSGWQPM